MADSKGSDGGGDDAEPSDTYGKVHKATDAGDDLVHGIVDLVGAGNDAASDGGSKADGGSKSDGGDDGKDPYKTAVAVESAVKDIVDEAGSADFTTASGGAEAISKFAGSGAGITDAIGKSLGTGGMLDGVISPEAARAITNVTNIVSKSFHVVEQAAHLVEEIAEIFERPPIPELDVEFESAGDSTQFEVRRMRGAEALSDLYEYTLELTSEHEPSPRSLLEHPATITTKRHDHVLRHVKGIVRRVEDLGSSDGKRILRVFLVPELWRLSQTQDSRIFQDRLPLDVVEAVLAAAHVYTNRIDRRINREYLQREFYVQYRESDLAFVRRILEEVGISFAFENHDGEEHLVFIDNLTGSPEVPLLDRDPIAVLSGTHPTYHAEAFRSFEWHEQMRPTGVVLRDYNFTHPSAVQDMTRPHPVRDQGARVVYDYPYIDLVDYDESSHVYKHHNGVRQAETRDQELQSDASVARGRSNVSNFSPGYRFAISAHGRDDLDGSHFVVTKVTHDFAADDVTRTDVTTDGTDGSAWSASRDRYRNRFEAVKDDLAIRPKRTIPRPIIAGTQTATVIGPDNEEIWVDFHGRIKVKFHWDRSPPTDNHKEAWDTSCWIRVSQVWAGASWGFSFVPRIGMEVIVSFLEGNADRPVVLGCLYNGASPTQYRLPDEKTKSWIRTQSSPGNDPEKFNEIRFEDKASHEQIYVHAQKDYDELVLHNHSTHVKSNQSNTVDANQTETIGVDQTMTVHGKRTKTVDKDESNTIKKNRTTEVDQNDTLTVGQNYVVIANALECWDPPAPGAGLHVTGEYNVVVSSKVKIAVGATTLTMDTSTVTIDAPSMITLKCGGSSIVIDPSNVNVVGPASVAMKSGSGTLALSPGNAEMKSGGASVTLAGSSATLDGADAKVHGKGTAKLVSDGEVLVSAPTAKVDGTGTATVHGGTVSITGDGPVTVTGSVVNLNC